MKTKKPLKKTCPSRAALMILNCGLPLVAAALIYIAFTTASLEAYDAARLYPLLYAELEHALMSLLLIVGGAVVCDLSVGRG